MSSKLRALLDAARKVTVCLDGWTKKGLTGSFLGISACFFDTQGSKAVHALLNVAELQHPHTGEAIASSLEECLTGWGISAEKVILVITDNGANMIKAVRLLREQEDRLSEGGDDESSGELDSDEDDIPLARLLEFEFPPTVSYRRLPCMAHSLQLVVKDVGRHALYEPVITKARKLVQSIRKSSVLMDKLARLSSKTVCIDCPTRWSSTYAMLKRLIDIKTHVNRVMTEHGIDTLLVSEWVKLVEVTSLLEPFAVQTDVLQTDALSLSKVVPSLKDLECHLVQFRDAESLTMVFTNL